MADPTDRTAITLNLTGTGLALLLKELDLYAFNQRSMAAATIGDDLSHYEAHQALADAAQKSADNLELVEVGDVTFSGTDRIAIMGALASRIVGYREMAARMESQGLTATAQTARGLETRLSALISQFNLEQPISADPDDDSTSHPGHSEAGD